MSDRVSIEVEGKTVEQIHEDIYGQLAQGVRREDLRLVPGKFLEPFNTGRKHGAWVTRLNPGDALFGVLCR